MRALLLLLLAALPACDDTTCDREPPLTWDDWGEAFLDDYCGGCHSALLTGDDRRHAPAGVDFNTYGDAMIHADRILARVVDSVDMPPAGGPSDEERALLEEWIVCRVQPDRERWEAQRP